MNTPRFAPKLTKVSSEQLAKFGSETPGINMAVLSTTDGFEVASYHADHAVSAKMAAMGSSLQALSEAIWCRYRSMSLLTFLVKRSCFRPRKFMRNLSTDSAS